MPMVKGGSLMFRKAVSTPVYESFSRWLFRRPKYFRVEYQFATAVPLDLPSCADCGGEVGNDKGPPDGWQLEDGRTVCHACCVKDTKKQVMGNRYE